MKTPQEYLDNAVKHHGSHLQMTDICVTEFVALEAIKKAQIDAIDEAVKLCAERACLNYYTDPWIVDKQSILDCAEILKKQL